VARRRKCSSKLAMFCSRMVAMGTLGRPDEYVALLHSACVRFAASLGAEKRKRRAAKRCPDPMSQFDLTTLRSLIKQLATAKRLSCPKCGSSMPAAIGYRGAAFECATCGRFETVPVPVDPLRTNAVGWVAGELRPPR
jgi:hypothetical protein